MGEAVYNLGIPNVGAKSVGRALPPAHILRVVAQLSFLFYSGDARGASFRLERTGAATRAQDRCGDWTWRRRSYGGEPLVAG